MENILPYLMPIKKWWWLLLLATVLAGATSFLVAERQPKVYQSRTTLVVGQTINQPNPSTGDVFLAEQLAAMYADMALREPVRQATMQALKLDWLPDYNARALANTQIIEITVNDTDPTRAKIVAAELANQLILRSPTSSGQSDQDRQKFINDQLATLQQQIKDTQAEIQKLNLQLGSLSSARDIADTQNQITALETKATTLQSTYASLLATTNQNATNTLSIFEPAETPSTPISPSPSKVVLLAMLIGLVLASLGAFSIEYIDPTLKTPADINAVTGLPILGYIAKADSSQSGKPYVATNARSIVAETFRSLRSNLETEGYPGGAKTLMVTSPGVSDGKSFVVVNLATILGQGDKDVIIVDGDFRKPQIHNFLGIPNQVGVNQIVNSKFPVTEAIYPGEDKIKGIITTGTDSESMLDSLDSQTAKSILEPIKRRADVVIVDSAPVFVPDTVTWAKNVDGVILVVRPEHTHKEVTKAAVELLRRSGVNLIGVVVNSIPAKKHGFGSYYGFQYYSAYYDSNHHRNGKEKESVGEIR